LQQMARWVAENIEGAIVIWVSLADLQGRSVEAYLLEQWLPAAVQQMGRAETSTQVKDAFVEQLNAERVWMLLDGVDEMPVAAGNPLSEMERQVRLGGLLAQSRIMLTCRLNLWDGDRHALDKFDVYRTLEFAYPGQVEQFVGQWFGALPPDAQVGQADRLCEALRRSGQERLRDLVKNPLRLTLLCFNWYLGEGTLPETKAGLYEQFVADFYVWKRERFPTTAAQRGQLNTALGELAREAIDKEETRFRLRHDFVCEFLGEPDEPNSLFEMALRLGWLNQIGVDAGNRRKAVYAFFHPTFQEYFAATTIHTHCFFINHFPDDLINPDSSYRIFLAHWKEVYLLWMGQEKVPRNSKEKLILKLVEFNDICNGLYKYKSYCLAGFGLSEFKSIKLTDVILEDILDWHFGYFKPSSNDEIWINFLNSNPIDNLVVQVIRETDRQAILKIITKKIYTNKSSFYSIEYARFVGDYGFNNIEAINALIFLMEESLDKQVRRQAIESLGAIGCQKLEVVNALALHLLNTKDDDEKCQIAQSLVKVDPGNSDGINILINFLLKSEDNFTSSQVGFILHKFDHNNEALNTFLSLLRESKNDQDRQILCKKIFYIQVDSPEVMDTIKKIFTSDCGEKIKLHTAASLLNIDPQNSEAISLLVFLLNTTQDLEIKKSIIVYLGMLSSNSLEAIDALNKLILYPSQDIRFLILSSEMLRHIGFENLDAIS
jgi:hypothetical protein